jgi:hypothetical protein
LVQENDIHVDLPGLKTFLSYSETDTEKSMVFKGKFFQTSIIVNFHENGQYVFQYVPVSRIWLSYSETDTEKSEVCSITVLDETADSKATVLKTLNILHKKFQIGIKLQYLVVVVYHFPVPNISENCKLTISSRNFPMPRIHLPFP